MRLSYSALDTFQNCPAKFKFQQIDKIKTPKSKEAIFGTAVHSALKMMHEPNRLPHSSEEELLQFFTQNWNNEPYENENEEMAFFHQGIKILKNYYIKNQPVNFDIVDLETRFEAPLQSADETHIITGQIDRIDKIENNQFEIIDYKTSRKMPSQQSVDENLQLSIYHLGIINRWPSLKNNPVKLSLYFLKHGEKLSTYRAENDIRPFQEKLINIFDKIKICLKEGKFEPRPNPLCDWCNYQNVCPFFKHKYLINQQGAEATIDDKQIAILINEFLELKNKNEELNKRIDEIKKNINDYCNQKNIERIFGESGYVTRASQQRFSYDAELVRQILEPINKWENIIKIDLIKLKKTIKELPHQIKIEIEKAKKLEKEFKTISVKFNSPKK